MKRWTILAVAALVIITLLQIGIVPVSPEIKLFNIGDGRQVVLRIGPTPLYGAITPDYIVDGVDDNAQAQTALDALPAGGGKLIFEVYNYDFSVTVARAIDNVVIEGTGNGSYFANDGSTALFSAGSQANWVFRDFRTDAGSVNVTSATVYTLQSVTLGATYYPLYVSSGTITAGYFVGDGSGLTGIAGGSGDGSSPIVFIASHNATAQERAGATVNCTGASDQVEINAALAANPRVITSSGTFEFDGDVVTNDNNALLGQGTSTIFNFTGGRFEIIDASYIEIGQFNVTGNTSNLDNPGSPLYHSGSIHIEPVSKEMTDIYVHNIVNKVKEAEATFYITSGADDVFASSYNITNVTFKRCVAYENDGFGFITYDGDSMYPWTAKNIRYIECAAYRCGANIPTQYNDAVCGFDVCEGISTNITVQDITLIDCISEENFLTGYHMEELGNKINVQYLNCTSRDNGLNAVTLNGYGFGLTQGTVTATDCYSDGDFRGYYIHDGNNPDAKIVLNNPISEDSASIGMYIESNSTGRFDINGGRIEDSGSAGMYCTDVNNLHVNGLKVINPVGSFAIGVFLGTGYPMSDSELDMDVITPAQFAISGQTTTNVTISGKYVSTNVTGYAADFYNPQKLTIHDTTFNAPLRGLRIDGPTSGNVTIRDSLFYTAGQGIQCDACIGLVIQNNRFFLNDTPININNANVMYPLVMGNSWVGCSNDISAASTNGTMITSNVDKGGIWLAGDDPG